MRVFTCTDFNGHWPVGAAAVIVAKDYIEATAHLNAELERAGLKQTIYPNQLKEIELEEAHCVILVDGNY